MSLVPDYNEMLLRLAVNRAKRLAHKDMRLTREELEGSSRTAMRLAGYKHLMHDDNVEHPRPYPPHTGRQGLGSSVRPQADA